MCVPLIIQFCGYRECWDLINRFNPTSWVAVDTPTDLPKSVRICFCNRNFWRFCVVTLLFGFYSVGVGTLAIGLSQISSFFSYIYQYLHFGHFIYAEPWNAVFIFFEQLSNSFYVYSDSSDNIYYTNLYFVVLWQELSIIWKKNVWSNFMP